MKQFSLKSLIIIGALSFVSNAFALSSDRNEPIEITSLMQHVEMNTNKIIFQGDVVLIQGSIKMLADEIIVTRDSDMQTIRQMQALGDLVTFSQTLDDGKLIRGQAKKVDYLIDTSQVLMQGQAQLLQDDNIIKGTSIQYNIKDQILVANGSKAQRVVTIFHPNEKDVNK